MAIATVVQRGVFIHAYDDRGRMLFTVPGRDGLLSYTSTSVSIRRGAFISVYNVKGVLIVTIPAS
jgi:hypothetical protein